MLMMYNRLTIEVTPEALTYFFAIFVGCLIRTMAPFIRKFLAGEVQEWDSAYTITFIISYIVAASATMFIVIANPLVEVPPDLIFPTGFVLGVTSNTIINEVKKWFFPG